MNESNLPKKPESILPKKPLWWRLCNAFTNVTLFIAAFFMIFTVAGSFSGLNRFFDLCSHVRLINTVVLMLYLLPCLLIRRWKLFGLTAGLVILNLIYILPLYQATPRAAPQGKGTIKVLQMNVNVSNRSYDKAIALVESLSPDVVLVTEMTPSWQKALDNGLKKYEFHQTIAREDCFGIGFYSRLPLKEQTTLYPGGAAAPAVYCKVAVGENRDLGLIGAHCLPPIRLDFFEIRNKQMSDIARTTSLSKTPMAVFGDLNCSPWSHYFEAMLKDGKLVDSESGYGPQPSWPAVVCGPLPWIPIDHVLTTADVTVVQRKLCRDIDSDHYPILVELAW